MVTNSRRFTGHEVGADYEQVYALVAFWLQALLYGIYVSLFSCSIVGLVKKKTAKVFCVGICMMFLLTSLDLCTKGYIIISAYALPLPEGKTTLDILHDYSSWGLFMHSVIENVVIWIADFLVIYRCYLIWERNLTVIILPSILLASSIAKNAVTLNWFLHPELKLAHTVTIFLKMCYPLTLAQNVLTTGLIAYRILRQHYQSRASGVRSTSGVSLITITRIIVESALIYTLLVLLLTILYQLNNRAIVLFESSIIPSSSITFVLMTVRISRARKRENTFTQSVFRFDVPSASASSSNSSPDSELEGGSSEKDLSKVEDSASHV